MRSTLEGRWAVFFDHLDIKWIYEPQRFAVGDGFTYLPDFLLPEHEVWVEVKGKATQDDIELLARAANPYTGLPGRKFGPRIVTLGNIPKVEPGWSVSQCVLSWERDDESIYGMITQYFEFVPRDLFGGMICEVGTSDPVMGLWHAERTLRVDATSIWHFDSRPIDHSDCPVSWGMHLHPRVVEAYQAARRAKFEPASHANGSGK